MTQDNLGWLQSWFVSHCDGDWEHLYGVTINSLDNPGWAVEISLDGTELENLVVERHQIARTESDWLDYEVREKKFRGFCGPANLDDVIAEFRQLAESHAAS